MIRELRLISIFCANGGFPVRELEAYEKTTLKISKLPVRNDSPLMASEGWQRQVRKDAALVNWGCNLLLYYTQLI